MNELKDLLRGPEGLQGEAVLRPSLWAGLDILAKILMVLVVLLLPTVIGILLHGGSVGLMTVIAALSFLQSFELLYGLLAALVPVVQLAFTRYVVDEEGVRVLTQFFTRQERTVRWDKVTMVRQRRTLVDRAFGIERIDVVAWGVRGTTLNLVGLRRASSLRDLLGRRMREFASVTGSKD